LVHMTDDLRPSASPRPAVRLVVVLLTLSLLTPAIAYSSDERVDGQSETPTQQAPDKPEPPPKVPPPPLFPKHRRGLYLNGLGLEVIDATPQSPPLETDDPGVPDKGVYEINLTTQGDFSRNTKKSDLLFVDANYGLLPTILGHELPLQLAFEVPMSAAKESGQPFTAGLGTANIGLKLNFYNNDRRGIAMAIYPQVDFVLGSRPVEKGLAEPGQTLIFPLLVSKELKYVTLVVNGAVNKPLHDPERRTTGTFGIGLGLAVTRKFAAMVEFHSESRFDLAHDRLLAVNVGLMRAVGHTVVLYTNVGRSLFSDDGLAHTYAGAGVKVLIKPAVKKPCQLDCAE
jgi:hypothetical protein